MSNQKRKIPPAADAVVFVVVDVVFRSEKEQLRLDDRMIIYFIYQSLRKETKVFNDFFFFVSI